MTEELCENCGFTEAHHPLENVFLRQEGNESITATCKKFTLRQETCKCGHFHYPNGKCHFAKPWGNCPCKKFTPKKGLDKKSKERCDKGACILYGECICYNEDEPKNQGTNIKNGN